MQQKPVVVNVSALNGFSKGAVVTQESLVTQGLVSKELIEAKGVKILGSGDITVALSVQVPVSKGAADKITKAGGSVDQK